MAYTDDAPKCGFFTLTDNTTQPGDIDRFGIRIVGYKAACDREDDQAEESVDILHAYGGDRPSQLLCE